MVSQGTCTTFLLHGRRQRVDSRFPAKVCGHASFSLRPFTCPLPEARIMHYSPTIVGLARRLSRYSRASAFYARGGKMEPSPTAMAHRSSTRLIPMKFAIRMRAMQCPAYCALAVPNTRTPLSLSDPDLHIARVQMDRGEGAKSKATLPSRVLVSHLSRLRPTLDARR